jgi:predicted transcriptional regulator
MTRNVQPVTLSTDLFETQQRMQEAEVEALPVVSIPDQYIGLISRQHIAELFRMVQDSPPIVQGRNAA